MIVYNRSMIEGSPLQYYQSAPPPSYFTFFNKFDRFSTEMSEDLIMPNSPNSTHSDSDNSLSSVEISTKVIQTKVPKPNKQVEVQCQWHSCGILFESLDQLAMHVTRVHAASGRGGLFYCGWEGCSRNNRGFNARYKMLVHVRTHTNEKPHQCCQCDKSFSRAENLKIHSRSHSGEKPYICPIPGCNKAYSNSSDRFKHTRTHQVEKPYKCKVPGCPKRYTDPSSLRKHVKTYKHFVNDAQNELINDRVTENIKKVEDINYNKLQNYQQNEDKHPCTCPHACCVSNNLSKAAELLKLGAFINLRHDVDNVNWNKMFDPFITQTKAIFKPYEIKDEQMEVDVPLDLSIGRKHL